MTSTPPLRKVVFLKPKTAAASTSLTSATATISGGSNGAASNGAASNAAALKAPAPKAAASKAAASVASKPADAKKKECEAFKTGNTCRFGSNCRDSRCIAAQKLSVPAKAAGGDGDGISKQIDAMESRLNLKIEALRATVTTGFEETKDALSAQETASLRMQEAMMMLMKSSASFQQSVKDLVSSGSTSHRELTSSSLRHAICDSTVTPVAAERRSAKGGYASAAFESSKRRTLPVLEEIDSDLDSDSGIALPNFERVTKKMTDCPINSAVESLIPPFVFKFFPDNPDPAACCILAILSGKKRSVLEKMGEFTRTKVVPLITVDNYAIFQNFFAILSLKCKSDGCVRVKNADGEEVSHKFHILGKEVDAILHIIRILREEK